VVESAPGEVLLTSVALHLLVPILSWRRSNPLVVVLAGGILIFLGAGVSKMSRFATVKASPLPHWVVSLGKP
jgi:hypothetical protein